ncbi:TonB-dependent receptor plug domain-containing protein, partial [Aliarcobacter butzleri]
MQNLDEALKLMFEGTGLEAVVKNNTIVIKKIEGKGTVLEPISVNESYKNGTAENGYLSEDITGVGLWGKRSLQDTPYSMTVISNDLIENSLAKDMNQIFKMNSTTQETATKSAPASDSFLPVIRGFNPRILVNGIPHSMAYRSTPIMQSIEKVEIINGATGFLYGGGRVGGAVNYITKKPTLEDLRSVTIGSYGDESYFSNIDLGGQFDNNHTFGYRVNALYQNGELPSTTNTEQKAISFVFDWKPTDNFYTDIKYSHKDLFEKGANTVFNSVTNRPIIKNQSYSPDWIENEVKSDIVENSVNWNINDIFTLRTNLSYEKTKHRGDSLDVVLKDNIALQNPTNYWRGTS